MYLGGNFRRLFLFFRLQVYERVEKSVIAA